jgi:endonuclease YncB( thermonuclease family)
MLTKYRLIGFDAPETRRPECDAEAELGQKATKRLEELIASGTARVIEKGKGGQIWPNARDFDSEWPRRRKHFYK